MLGKSRAFSMSEFQKQMRNHKITCISVLEYKNEMRDEAVAIVEGGLMNPLEQDLLEELYFKKEKPIVRVGKLECHLAAYIDDNKLLMSLKLSKNSERLHNFLKNPLIADTLFLKLLKIYDFKNEGFFDTDDNRDVTTSLIERFYDNLEANHNIQYISLGIIQLINKSESCELINTLASLSIVSKALKKSDDELLEVMVQSLAKHHCLNAEQQLKFAKSGSSEVGVILASRDDLELSLEQLLLSSEYEAVKARLATNAKLSTQAIASLREDYEASIILHVNLSDTLFKTFQSTNATLLAQNPTLTETMANTLFLLHNSSIHAALAKNETMPLWLAQKIVALCDATALQNLAQNGAVPEEILMQLYANENLHVDLAANTNLSKILIKQLSRSNNIDILSALAQNSATPLELLYEFLLDMRLENIVRQNPALNDKYQR